MAPVAHGQTAAAYHPERDPGQPTAQSDAPGEIGVICLSNACMKAAPSEPRRDAAAAARAIEAGDVAGVMKAGGVPEDVLAAMRSRLSQDPDALLNPDAARQVPLSLWMSGTERHLNEGAVPRFIQDRGRTSLAFFSPAGRLVAVTRPPGLNGAGIPPRGAAYDVPAPASLPPPPPPFGEFSAQ